MPPKKKDVQLARGRLKGALQDAVSTPDEDEEVDNSVPLRGRPRVNPPKRMKMTPAPLQQTFIMKLFDRSVDLAKYNESTALYPICRAWMLNTPRSNKIPNFNTKPPYVPEKRKAMPTLVGDLITGKVDEVTELPECNADVNIDRMPSPLPFHKDCSKDNIDLDYDLDKPPVSREILLDVLKSRGIQIRRKWQQHSKAYTEAKYGASFDVLKAIYKQ